jgi:hypothetical protein
VRGLSILNPSLSLLPLRVAPSLDCVSRIGSGSEKKAPVWRGLSV